MLDYFIDHQSIGTYGLVGFFMGIVGTIIIALGNMFIKKFIKKEDYMNSPLKRFL